MARRRLTQRLPGGSASLTALALVALCPVAPAIASFNTDSACPEITENRLKLSAADLEIAVVPPEVDAIGMQSSPDDAAELTAPTRFLSPGAEDKAVDELESAPTSLASEAERPPVNARMPGLSDDEMSRYKRQMYRKDI